MKAIFNGPMAPVEFENSLWRSLVNRKAGDSIDRFIRFSIFLYMRYLAVDTENLAHIREIQIAVQFLTGPDTADFYASMSFVDCLVLRGSVNQVKIFDIFFEGRLVILNSEDIVRFFFVRPGNGPFLVGYAMRPE